MPENRTRIYALRMEDLTKVLLPHLRHNGAPEDSIVVATFDDRYRGTLNCLVFSHNFEVVAPGLELPLAVLEVPDDAPAAVGPKLDPPSVDLQISESAGGAELKRLEAKAWVAVGAPVVRAPFKLEMKGFRGFRYTEDLW